MTVPRVVAGSMSVHLSSVWACLFLLVVVAGGVSMDFFPLPKADMIQFDSTTETIIVGGRRRLKELSMDLREQQSAVVDSLVEFDNLEQCRKQFRVLGREDQIPFYCHYDVTLVLLPKPGVTNSTIDTYPSSQTILYCSTTDNVAVCAHVQRSNFSNVIRFIPGLKYSSLHADVPTVAGIGSDGNFWGISSTGKRTEVDFVRSDYNLDSADASDSTVWLTQESERMYWFRDSGYASIIEDEDYVYVFFWETPLEGSDDRPVARVARVCKTDPGIDDPRLTIKVFRSFVKAQLICNSTLSQSDTSTTKVYPFITDVFHINGTLDQETFSDMVYAVFQSSSPLDSDGPTGSALCVFDFAKIRAALDSTMLTNLRTRQDVASAPIDCASAGTRTIEDVTEVTLSTTVVGNERSHLLHLIADGERFLRVVVDQATSLDGQTYDVVFVLSTHKFFEKLYLYKMTYSTGRRNNVAKVSSKVEVMAAEKDLLTDDIYGSYLPHKGNRMKLHHWDGKTWLYITSEAGVFRLRTDDCSRYVSCGECVMAQDPHCAFDEEDNKCVSIKDSTGRSNLLQDMNNGDASVCNDVTVGPTSSTTDSTTDSNTDINTDSNPPHRSSTTTAASPSPLPSSSPISSDPPTGPPTNETPNVGGLSTSAPDMSSMWWAFVLTLALGLIAGFVVGIFVSLYYQVYRAIRMPDRTTTRSTITSTTAGEIVIVPPLVPTNDKRRGSRRGSSGSVGVKPNNAVEDPGVEAKGKDHSKDLSPEQCQRSVTSADVTAIDCSPSEHSLFLGNKCNDPPTSVGTMCVQRSNPNLVDSSSDSPQSPVTNWARNHFKGNIDSSDRGYYKTRHTSTSSACAGPWENHSFSQVSQGSYTASYNGAVGNTSTLPRSQASHSRPTSMGSVPPQFSRLSSHGVVDGYAQVGSPVSASGRMMSLEQRRSLLVSTPERYGNGHVTLPYSNCSDC